MWDLFKSKACAVCAEKDRRLEDSEKRISDLYSQISTLKSQLSHSREREERAVDAALEQRGAKPVTPPPRMSAKDSENAYVDAMAIFKDSEDIGDGKILEADNLNVQVDSPV